MCVNNAVQRRQLEDPNLRVRVILDIIPPTLHVLFVTLLLCFTANNILLMSNIIVEVNVHVHVCLC